ncbi:hypothetical protein NLJ89_g3394 [Agrocybe chaxingu]|uniref:DNA 3'-5' helicase n=1 Tax=Agrocybe chaxingu TaxID=84603 RepID=A0A9W8K4Z1_9AGAR|nr:hypothetical protein NLJ89_g3394 [Agrocybe chaxingu]
MARKPSSATTTPSSATGEPIAPAFLLKYLNPAQLKAVQHEASIPLQILAGPGSGKTKVLTSRIAHLILVHGVPPAALCAVTFTNKAANEMRSRLCKLIGNEKTTMLKLGTFHSICARFIRMYSSAVGLVDNFTICDAEERQVKKLIISLMKPYKDYMVKYNILLTEGSAAVGISKAKAKGKTAAVILKETEEKDLKRRREHPVRREDDVKSIDRILAEVYVGYEKILQDNNALDFDDLLIYGVRLFTQHQESVLWCKHILVDEFQDTNTMQYELMKAIGIRHCVTVVGDPDQSIYGWRSAEVGNLGQMREDFPGTQQIFLKQNYRSTAAILRSCLAIVSEAKSLHTTHPLGTTPFLCSFGDEKEEAGFIAAEVKRCVANMGGVLKWSDFVILMRFNALSRPIESALQKEGIPCRILGGHKFFERMEIKDLLAYLQLIDNLSFSPAFLRVVKVPPRGIGDRSIEEIAAQSSKLKISQLELVERIHDGKVPDIKPSIKRKLVSFVNVIRALRALDEKNTLPSEMIRKLLDLINYEDYLKKSQQDWESRWENVKELITFASEVETEGPKHNFSVIDADGNPIGPAEEQTILRQFLQSSMLSTEGDNETEDESKDKVTLSTCHSAKGLEWPVVIIPSVDNDTFPFYRTEDIEEERRLLYVACTRAQTLLYLLYSEKRQVAGKTKNKGLSEFVDDVKQKDDTLFTFDVPVFALESRTVISKVLERPLPDEAEIKRRLAELDYEGDRVQPLCQTSSGFVSTISLVGTKRSIMNVPLNPVNASAIYAAPDALAAISATFLRDYNKKAPFSKSKRHAKPSSSYMNNSFVAAAAAIHPDSMGPTPHGDIFTAFDADRSGPAQGHNPDSSRPGPRDVLQPPRQTLDHWSTPRSQPSFSTNATVVSGPVPPRNRVFHLHPSLASSGPLAPGSVASDVVERKAELIAGNTQQTSTKIQSTGPFLHLQYDQNYPPGECSSRPSDRVGPKPPKIQRIIPSTPSYETPSVPAMSSTMVSSPPKASHYTRLCPVSELPSLQSLPRIQSSNSPHTNSVSAPQTVGVKRRLGMGRTTTGYSNKKFKPPL